MKKENVWAVIPAFNEGKRIGPVLSRAKKYVSHVVVVDDGSRDDTSAIAKKETAHVLCHIINLGKGAALKTGCDYAVKNGAEIIVVLDADAQHDPSDIPRFIAEMKDADIVFGCRSFNSEMPGILRFGNWFISQLTMFLYGVKIEDTQSGFRAFSSSTYPKIRWRAKDYSMESEMIAKVGRHRLRYKKIKIETLYPDRYKGTTVFDGVKIVLNLLRWKVFRNGG